MTKNKTHAVHLFADQETSEMRVPKVTNVSFEDGELVLWCADRKLFIPNVSRFEVTEE